MKHLLAIAFITLLALGTGCAWISPSSQTTSDGIQVHGHWNVTVTNPDGSVDAVHEFDNDLTETGKAALGALLARDIVLNNNPFYYAAYESPTVWQIQLVTNNNNLDCEEEMLGFSGGNKLTYLQTRYGYNASAKGLNLTATCTPTNSSNQNIKAVKTIMVTEDAGQAIVGVQQLFFTEHYFQSNEIITVEPLQTFSFNISITFD